MKSNLKNNEQFLNLIGEVRDDLIPDQTAKAPNRALKITLSAMCGLCAAFAIVGVGMKVYSRIHDNIPTQPGSSVTDVTAETTTAPRQSTAENSLWAGYTAASRTPEKTGTERVNLYLRGFNNAVSVSDGDRYYGLDIADPGRSTMPVFRNTGCDAIDGSNTEPLLSEEQTKALVQRASELLGLPDVSVDMSYADDQHTVLRKCIMTSDEAEVSAECDGTVTVQLRETVPKEYAQSDDKMVEYLAEKYGPLAGWAHTAGYVKTVFVDDEIKICRLFEESDDLSQEVLNESLSYIEFAIDTSDHETGSTDLRIGLITFRNALLSGEYLGEYELIPLREAVQKFMETDLHTAGTQDYPPLADYVEGGKVTADRIAKAELVYLYASYEEVMAPYYRIWVDVTDFVKDDPYTQKMQADLVNGRHYMPLEVPAVRIPGQTADNTAADTAGRKTLWEGLSTASCKPEKAGTEKLTLSGQYFNESMISSENEVYYGGKTRSADIARSTLPVFRNLGYNKEEPALSTQYLSEEETLELLNRAADLLQIPEAPVEREYRDADRKYLYGFSMPNNLLIQGQIAALRDGSVMADLRDTSDKKSNAYIEEKYAPLAGWTDTKSFVLSDGTVHVYEASDDPVQELLNDSLCYIEARWFSNGNMSLSFSNPLTSAEYIGEYALIPVEEAK